MLILIQNRKVKLVLKIYSTVEKVPCPIIVRAKQLQTPIQLPQQRLQALALTVPLAKAMDPAAHRAQMKH